jgi:diacylglycerol O-acyltransferase
MSAQDALWLTMDRPNNLMVVDVLLWFRSEPDWDAVEQVVDERLVRRFPVFGCRAVRGRRGWAWVEDEDFTLGHHLSYQQLPADAGPAQLADEVGARRSEPLDRDRPLWSMTAIGPVRWPDGATGAALLARFHHAIADGVRLTEVAFSLCDVDGAAAPVVGRRPPPADPKAVVGSAVRTVAEGVSDVLGSTLNAGAVLAGGLASGAAQGVGAVRQGNVAGPAASAAAAAVATGGQAVASGRAWLRQPVRVADLGRRVSSPGNRLVNDALSVPKLLLTRPQPLPWRGRPGIDKAVAWAGPLPISELKAIGTAADATLNDVALGIVAGACTRYLRAHRASVDELVWMVPVSLKPFGTQEGDASGARGAGEASDRLGNHFSLVMARMPIGVDDPVERLAQIHEHMTRVKNSDEPYLTSSVQRGIAAAPGPLSTRLTNFFADKTVGVLTNVPGPPGPMRLAGTEVDGVVGWAPCSGHQAISVALVSYRGAMQIGLATDVTLIPDADRLVQDILDEYADLHAELVG